jgi:hypothetical protein
MEAGVIDTGTYTPAPVGDRAGGWVGVCVGTAGYGVGMLLAQWRPQKSSAHS